VEDRVRRALVPALSTMRSEMDLLQILANMVPSCFARQTGEKEGGQ